jgi:gliding motility-associated-like protein
VPSFLAANTGTSPITSTITVIPELGGCAGPAEIYTITINPLPTALISGGGTMCQGASASINISLTGAAPWGVTYTDGSTSSSVSGITSSPYVFDTPVTGTYTVIAVSDANCNGTASGSATVSNYAPITAAISGPSTVCEGASTTLLASASGGLGPYVYNWTPVGTGSGNSVTVNPSASTTYSVTISDGCATDGSATYVVNVLDAPQVNFASNIYSGCAPLCINLTDMSTPSGSIASWSWELGGVSSSAVQNPTTCFQNPGQYSIGLTVTGTNGCQSTLTNNNMITVNALPDAEISAADVVSILESDVQFISSSTDAVTWSWNFGDPGSANNTSNLEHPVHSFENPGNYCVTLTVQNSTGCTDMTTYCVEVQPEFTFYIPNAFTPNGSGNNDVFMGKGENIGQFEMSIYDRWGNLVFFTDDVTKGWDGRMKESGEICQMDVYVYNIALRESTTNQLHTYIGKVTLVK